ncbi:MAG: GTP-binding protein, partial [Clostridiales bacterium]|nr:GTP-binding protein [Clostridiales bacterium]
ESLGRVDRGNARLDTNRIEKQRGITIFSQQAIFKAGELCITLLDTPGHADFAAEAERAVQAMDYAILVISAVDGVQAHSLTLWNILQRHGIPVFIWVNKMDLAQGDSSLLRADIMRKLRARLSEGCIDFSLKENACEAMALSSEEAFEEFSHSGQIARNTAAKLISERRVFPCLFGSSLKHIGISKLLQSLEYFIIPKDYPEELSGKIFKINRDEEGVRLSWIKLTGGKLKFRDEIEGEKVSGIRLYSAGSYKSLQEAHSGMICALTGLENTYAGQGIGREKDIKGMLARPLLSHRIVPTDGTEIHSAYSKLLALSEPGLISDIEWDGRLRQIRARLMGQMQAQVLTQLAEEELGLSLRVQEGEILYKETIESPVTAAAHYEAPRHYAEIHLLMEPLPAGMGIIIENVCGSELDDVWQRIVVSQLSEANLVGVLTGSPLTDIKISLIAGRAQKLKSEGGDFREAAMRAVRQGLMKARNILLEPWYRFRLEVPASCIGRAINDIKAMKAIFEGPAEKADCLMLEGSAPAIRMQEYAATLAGYSKGEGRLSFRFDAYRPCHNAEEVIERCGYDAGEDLENPSDSMFYSHGEALRIPWHKAEEYMHIDSGIKLDDDGVRESGEAQLKTGNLNIDEKEFREIMSREFGPARKAVLSPVTRGVRRSAEMRSEELKKDLLIVDAYNIIFAWDRLKKIASGGSLSAARDKLIDILSNYGAFRGCETLVVFDGYKVKEGPGSKEASGGLNIVYTKQGESADVYIEKFLQRIGRNYRVR